MASQDLYSFVSPAVVFGYTNPTGNSTGLSSAVDIAGFESATILAHNFTAAGTTTVSYELRESDSTASGTFTAVADDNLIGLESDLGMTSGTTGVVRRIGYVGNKRYLAVAYTATAVQTGATFAVQCLRGHPVNIQS
jgi:hypothetical protein